MNQENKKDLTASPAETAIPPRTQDQVVDLDIPGAERRISLTIGSWRVYNGSRLVSVPDGVADGDAYRNLWVMGAGAGQIRMYTETNKALYLNENHALSRWEAVDGAVEQIIRKTIAGVTP